MSDKKVEKKSMSTFWRIFPGIAFAVALCAMVIGVYGGGEDKDNQRELRYQIAKKSMTELLAKPPNVKHIEKWRTLSDEFFDIYAHKIQWEKNAATLFLAAEATEILANYTLISSDYMLAIESYEQLALRYRKNALADDALYRSASIRVDEFKDINAGLELLQRISTQYRRGDILKAALNLEKNLNSGVILSDIRKNDKLSGFMNSAPYLSKIVSNNTSPKSKQQVLTESGKAKPAKKASVNAKGSLLTKISWDSKTNNQVEIVIELNKSAKWQTVLQKSKLSINKLDRIVLKLDNTTVIPEVGSGAYVQGSLLTKIRIYDDIANTTKVYFDFKAVKGYETKIIQKPYKLIILVDSKKSFRNKGLKQNSKQLGLESPVSPMVSNNNAKNKADLAKDKTALESVNRKKSLNLAEQLGLGINSVFIDAGHGGKDPGAMGNKIVESKITLDVARRLGKILKKNGFVVHYSRTKDMAIPLSARSQRANELKADLFISIHVNANTDSRVSGFETYYLDFATTKRAAMVATLENASSDRTLGQLQTVMASIMLNEKKYESVRFAKDIKEIALAKINKSGYNIEDGGLKSAPFHVLIDASMPSVLVEIGYCTNVNDAKKIANPRYRQAVAEGIANAIIRYNTRLKKGKLQ